MPLSKLLHPVMSLWHIFLPLDPPMPYEATLDLDMTNIACRTRQDEVLA